MKKSSQGEGIFRKAIAKAGILPKGKIYGFTPILPFGGTISVDTLKAQDALAHMAILMQAQSFEFIE